MFVPRFTTILAWLLVAFIGNLVYNLTRIFSVLECAEEPCFTSALVSSPKLQLALFTSVKPKANYREVQNVYRMPNFDYFTAFDKDFTIDVPATTRRNGTLFLHVAVSSKGAPLEWNSYAMNELFSIHTTNLTSYILPRTMEGKLIDAQFQQQRAAKSVQTRQSAHKERPITHLRTHVYISLMTDPMSISRDKVPIEMLRQFHINQQLQILPILRTDFFHTRLKDLIPLNKSSTNLTFTFHYKPIGLGKLRLMLLIENAIRELYALGFRDKDVDEVKGIFADTNVYLISGTVIIIGVHMLLDFLSFKNDVAFWRRKSSYAGLSTRTTLWRAFSQLIIFLHLIDEETSLLILVPCGIGFLIEVWKCKKILRIELFTNTKKNAKKLNSTTTQRVEIAEQQTKQLDREGMRYLSYMLYPLCIGLAIYSLIYEKHRSWYAWTLHSLVNGVYAFGFLFMLPQLFINYKLKSVAALPWRAFMYKAFNTFIDDIFAFMITMPTSHRLACFRDDVVFMIYLYQRWLYPVDKTRIDNGSEVAENELEPDLKTELSDNFNSKKQS